MDNASNMIIDYNNMIVRGFILTEDKTSLKYIKGCKSYLKIHFRNTELSLKLTF